MGSGLYSTVSSVADDGTIKHARADVGRTAFYAGQPISATFKQRSINNAMDPSGIVTRESRDSEEHPNSVAIIIGLDVTGSMGSIPHALVKTGLPHMMGSIIQRGLPDPQVLFLGIGDHECDRSPLQVGQFESSNELLDKWLTEVWLEGGGGGNDGESYLLAWYFSSMHTKLDCFEKRNQKGFLFTIGDEPVLSKIPAASLHDIMGPGQYPDYTAHELFEKASEKYHVFHIHVKETASGSRSSVVDGWRQLLSDNLLIVDRHEDIPNLIAAKVLELTQAGTSSSFIPKEEPTGTTEEIIL